MTSVDLQSLWQKEMKTKEKEGMYFGWSQSSHKVARDVQESLLFQSETGNEGTTMEWED